jgi:thiamine kinase-like enzyme
VLVELTGIIDWEYSGFYPEYWEMMKVMHTR